MIKGSLTALVTPFDGERLDEDALQNLVDWQIKQGSHGLVPVGTTGESPTLSSEEHKRVIELTVEAVNGRVPVIAGAGSNNTAEAIEYSRHAEAVGADALLHVAGYYNRPSQEGLYQHFKAVHDSSNLPIFVYNIPARSVVGVDVETLARLSELPRIAGVKDATTDISRPGLERLLIKREFSWLSGEDATAVPYNAGGGNGCISVTANVAPDLCSKMQQACLDGDYQTALDYQDLLMPLHQALFLEPSPAGIKYALSQRGLCSDHYRLPMVPLSKDTKYKIEQALEVLG